MNVLIMMRALDQDSGFYAYVDGLAGALLNLKSDHKFILLYQSSKWFGKFSSYTNATEILVRAPKLIWDQVISPYVAWKHSADVIFNPKFSVPLVSPCPVLMGLQEPGWWIWPEHNERFDVLYQKTMMPVYIRKAAHLFPMCQWVVDENKKYINLPFDNVTVAYPGVQEHLRPIHDPIALEQFSLKYNLPSKFILSMARVDNPGMKGSRKWNPSKNAHTTMKAFLLCKDKIPHDIVFAGRKVREYFLHLGFNEKDFDRVHFVNFVPFNEIQFLFSLADLLVVPSYYESFGFALQGGIACGCPAVVSTAGACSEVVGNAGIYADPDSPEDFAEKIAATLNNEKLLKQLRIESVERASLFNWEKTAKVILGVMEKVAYDRHTQ